MGFETGITILRLLSEFASSSEFVLIDKLPGIQL
jgi:hypothetical protein